jgi:hypothetical protein
VAGGPAYGVGEGGRKGPPTTMSFPYQLPASNQSKVRVTARFQYL